MFITPPLFWNPLYLKFLSDPNLFIIQKKNKQIYKLEKHIILLTRPHLPNPCPCVIPPHLYIQILPQTHTHNILSIHHHRNHQYPPPLPPQPPLSDNPCTLFDPTSLLLIVNCCCIFFWVHFAHYSAAAAAGLLATIS